MLDTDLRKFWNAVSDWTIESSSVVSKKLKKEMTRCFEMIFKEIRYDAANVSGDLKTFFSIQHLMHCTKSEAELQCCRAGRAVSSRLVL